MLKLPKPKLIDLLSNTQVKINNKWYIAKSYERSGLIKWLVRIRDSYHVLIGKQSAFVFAEDLVKSRK